MKFFVNFFLWNFLWIFFMIFLWNFLWNFLWIFFMKFFMSFFHDFFYEIFCEFFFMKFYEFFLWNFMNFFHDFFFEIFYEIFCEFVFIKFFHEFFYHFFYEIKKKINNLFLRDPFLHRRMSTWEILVVVVDICKNVNLLDRIFRPVNNWVRHRENDSKQGIFRCISASIHFWNWVKRCIKSTVKHVIVNIGERNSRWINSISVSLHLILLKEPIGKESQSHPETKLCIFFFRRKIDQIIDLVFKRLFCCADVAFVWACSWARQPGLSYNLLTDLLPVWHTACPFFGLKINLPVDLFWGKPNLYR